MMEKGSNFSTRHHFSDWPNPEIPRVTAGVYVIWNGGTLIYCGMSGREIESKRFSKKKYGLITRLASHASGRLSGNQFCVYVANRLIIPSLSSGQLELFATGELTLDLLTKNYIHEYLEYQYLLVDSSTEAYEIEREARSGQIFSSKPFLNPL